MKLKSLIIFIMTALLLTTAQISFADKDKDKPTNSVAMSTILQNLQAKGIVAVQKIRFNDGIYEAVAFNTQGQQVNVRINPQTGTLLTPATAKNKLSMLQAVKLAEGAGYPTIYKVKLDDDKYKMKALNNKGKEVTLELDADSGKIDD